MSTRIAYSPNMTGVNCIAFLKFYGVKKIYGKSVAELRKMVDIQNVFVTTGVRPAAVTKKPKSAAVVTAQAAPVVPPEADVHALGVALSAPAAPAVPVVSPVAAERALGVALSAPAMPVNTIATGAVPMLSPHPYVGIVDGFIRDLLEQIAILKKERDDAVILYDAIKTFINN